MRLPSEDPEAARVVTLPVLSEILRHMVDIFEPDTGRAGCDSFQHSLKDPSERVDKCPTGWLTYFSHKKGTVPPLPAPVRIEPVGAHGQLLVLTPERVSASVPEHVELGRVVRKLLIKAGLVETLPGKVD